MCASEQIKYIGDRYSPTQEVTPIFRCKQCSLVFPNPMPIPLKVGDHYDVEPTQYWDETYLSFDQGYFKKQINTLKSLSKSSDIIALDIGAGLGKAMKAMRNQGWKVMGMEPSKAFYNKALELGYVNAEELKYASLEEVNYESDFFQFITFGAVLEHLYNPSEALIKALDWLAPNGLIQIEVPNAHWLTHKLVNSFYKLKGKRKVANLSPLHSPYHLYEFSLASFEQHGATAGYDIAKYTYYVCDTYFPKVLDPILKPYMDRTNSGMQLEVWLRKK